MNLVFCAFTVSLVFIQSFRQIKAADDATSVQQAIDFLMTLDVQKPIRRLVAFYEDNSAANAKTEGLLLNLHRSCSARGIFLSAAKISSSAAISHVHPNQPPLVAAFIFTSAAPTASFLKLATERTNRVFWVYMTRAGRVPSLSFLRADTNLMLASWETGGEVQISRWNGAGFSRNLASWKSGDKVIPLAALTRPAISLAGKVVSVAVFHDPPFVILPENETNPAQESLRGWLVELWLDLQSRMNFTSKFYRPARQSGGIFKRAVSELQSGRSDVVLSPFAIVLGDSDVVDFLFPVTTLSYGFVVPRVSATSSLNQFLQPFPTSLWQAIAAILTLTAILMTTAYMVGQNFGFEPPGRPLYGFYESVLIIYGSLLTQGPDFSPRSMSARTILWCSYAFGVLIGLAYSASITSKLTLGILEPPFRNLQDFIASSYAPLLITDSAPHRLISSAEFGVWREIRERKPYPRTHQNIESALTEVASSWSSTTLLDAKERIYPKLLDLSLECKLTLASSESVLTLPGHLMISKMSPMKKAIDQKLAGMSASGQLSRLRSRWVPATSAEEFCPQSKTTLLQFGMENVALPFYILVGGICLGVLVLFFEFVTRKFLWDHFRPLEVLRQLMVQQSTTRGNY